MVMYNIKGGYFEWMYQLVKKDINKRANKNGKLYRKLLRHLHDIEFIYLLNMDENRAVEGIDLRYRFGYECGYSIDIINDCFGSEPCSVLEMMVALSMHCEEHYMTDPEKGDRLGIWFWGMINNLGLGLMDDYVFDESYTDSVIGKFLRREYKSNGEGGLFKVEKANTNLTRAEIWYQMCWFLDSIL